MTTTLYYTRLNCHNSAFLPMNIQSPQIGTNLDLLNRDIRNCLVLQMLKDIREKVSLNENDILVWPRKS